MASNTALIEAQATCEGLHRLIRKISAAATDMDKGGSGSYELLALIASANTCAINLETQLAILQSDSDKDSNVHPIKRQNPNSGDDQSTSDIKIAK